MATLFKLTEGPLHGGPVLHPANTDHVGDFTTLVAAQDAAEERHGQLRWIEAEIADDLTVWRAGLPQDHAVEIEVVYPIHKVEVTAQAL